MTCDSRASSHAATGDAPPETLGWQKKDAAVVAQKTWLVIRALRLDGVRLGAYDHEKMKATQVRIDVRLRLAPTVASAPDALASVVDYVAVADAIARVARERHFDLVETLATKIACALLASFPLILSVRLQVQKPSGLTCGTPAVIVHQIRD